ncbi:FAD dependent oxidoreductase superfamily [Sporothrix brasiliensis 5110]|uniref:FAD dependent oxidoreductase superfamily n=1 Tax=Sporothrix brasiliensis 5110 TaxID=1398154 RepID=A0A0C2IZ44_9PEZI|nr:FAD dependent oxidoreductase superfamily [Sporothrix brasiliensis 5110]KIH94386.1 FAD dependent oxidoreductase superfamily [Sporothrix brasiliensis 5110]
MAVPTAVDTPADGTPQLPQPPQPPQDRRRHIVIVGGGVIGSTTAYFLTRHPRYDRDQHQITLLEATPTIAAGASGKAGGLLGLWAYPEELVPLSYRLHCELADEHGGAQRWGYRRVGCGHVQAEVSQDDLVRRAAETAAAKETKGQNSDADTKEAAPERNITDAPKTNTEAQSEAQPEAQPEAQKDWEKLPKQDEHAARLLSPTVLPPDLDWIDPAVVQTYDQMGVPGAYDTAQVHPFHFTTSMAALAAERGVDIRLNAHVTKIASTGDDGATAKHTVEYRDRTASHTTQTLDDITDVVVAAGPWTGVVLPRAKIEGLRAHSVVWEADVSAYAVFTDVGLPSTYIPEYRLQAGQKRRRHRGRVDPEIYARPFGEVYACGEPDSSVPLPATADLVQVDDRQCADLVAYVSTISPALAVAPVKATQACYLPRHIRFGDERAPLIGPTHTPGLWVAAGHTCWGIQNGPATGCLMAEMLLDGKATSADVSKFDPRKFKV